ncbi:myosin light chain kinase, putative [Entamoeba invadens IP1]|uniref:non-specific serine/threonine protein kinase n=1 Tax=Entamoeba invadens IP1 TaxID=370355 RepID=A0A0A1UHB0_ENTIV|nr:myosin light chain kinase, putative [Entamoeba invadens IP1]ELP95007.1 myosin light chain kinase, putative [Entamoeba invadens IP1]|eukprot:XP_004261778.1 myosin light chain kinase, putative [Entamoeba invadens IP1]
MQGTTAVVVRVLEGRNMPKNKTKPFDLYVRFKNTANTQSFQTSTQEKTTSPKWTDQFDLSLPTNLINKKTLLLFHVWANGFFKESIGTLKVEMTDEKYKDKWYPIELDKKFPKSTQKPDLRVTVEIVSPQQAQTESESQDEEVEVKEKVPEVKENDVLVQPEYNSFDDFKQKYLITNNELGEGAFSVVFPGQVIATKERVAIKRIIKEGLPEDQLEAVHREISLMRRLRHKNIVRLLDVYENNEMLYLVLEYIEGGELYERLAQSALKERQAACLVAQLVSALVYLHKNNIAHRDLKPENILCVYKDGLYVKIADFGLSKDFSSAMLQTCCGTASYVAPEVINGEPYTCQCDIWSLGVIAYLAISGNLPFYDDDEDVIFDKILEGTYEFTGETWDNVSAKAKDFIEKCLTQNPLDRPTSFELVKHPWLSTAQVRLDVDEEMDENKNRFTFDNACGYIVKCGNTLG